MLSPIQSDNLAMLPGIRHGFFTRQGGVSRGVYASLNCGQGSSDDRVSVTENRQLVAQHLGAFSDDVQSVYQVHGADVQVVDRLIPREEIPKADALVTKVRGLAIGILTADCAPVLFAEPKAKIVGAAHAGWRGALGGVLEATVATMEAQGADRKRITAALGPTISARAYEVGPEFVEAFVKVDASFDRFFRSYPGTKKPHFDLPAFVVYRLGLLGLKAVDQEAHCTYQNESMFFSFRRTTHRKEADYGRQISAIVVA